jgi:hypothetical protein
MLKIQAVSKRALQLWKLVQIYSDDMHSVLPGIVTVQCGFHRLFRVLQKEL